MLERLDHVLVAVRDLEVATHTTAVLLGRPPSWRGEHPGQGTANTLFGLENTYLELIAPAGEGPQGTRLRRWLDAQGEGPLGLAFGTPDADACREALAALEPGPVERGMGRDVESGAFRAWRRFEIPLQRTRGVLLFAIEHSSAAELLPRADVVGEEAAAVLALDHAVVQSRDADASRALYEGLGLRLALDRSFEAWGARLLFFRVGGVTVEIAARLGSSPEPDAPDRLWGLSYRVGDADAARARLHGEGFDVSEVRSGRRPGTRVFTVRGEPCGVATLMLESSPAPARG